MKIKENDTVVELELPCATQDNELIIQKGKIIQ